MPVIAFYKVFNLAHPAFSPMTAIGAANAVLKQLRTTCTNPTQSKKNGQNLVRYRSLKTNTILYDVLHVLQYFLIQICILNYVHGALVNNQYCRMTSMTPLIGCQIKETKLLLTKRWSIAPWHVDIVSGMLTDWGHTGVDVETLAGWFHDNIHTYKRQ